MYIVKHPSSTMEIGKSSDLRDNSCASLPITKVADHNGNWSVSMWKPTEEDLACLVKGGSIALWVLADGEVHPVVGLGTEPACLGEEVRGLPEVATSVKKDNRTEYEIGAERQGILKKGTLECPNHEKEVYKLDFEIMGMMRMVREHYVNGVVYSYYSAQCRCCGSMSVLADGK